MGISYNPRVVTDGLVLCLDAGNTKSYPGSGTTWTDLSGNGYNGTLTNGPTYSSSNGGSIVFDGVNDFSSFSEIILTPPWTSITVFKITESTSTTTFRSTFFGNGSTSRPGFNVLYNDLGTGTARIRLLTRVQLSNATWNWLSSFIGPYGSSYVDTSLQDAYWVNNIFHLTTTVSASNQYNFYVNGELKSTLDRTVDLDNGFRSDKIGAYASTSLPIPGNIYHSSVYSTELSSDQVQQNYNAIKSRFQ